MFVFFIQKSTICLNKAIVLFNQDKKLFERVDLMDQWNMNIQGCSWHNKRIIIPLFIYIWLRNLTPCSDQENEVEKLYGTGCSYPDMELPIRIHLV